MPLPSIHDSPKATAAPPAWIEIGRHLRINLFNEAQALEEIARRLTAGRGFRLATLNLDHSVLLQEPGAFRDAYDAHDLITADGMPIAWLARRQRPDVERISGTDLMISCLSLAGRLDVPVALIGATEHVLDRAADAMISRAPDLQIVARIAPSYPFDPFGAEADALIAQIEAKGARLCFLALGAPRQEILASRIGAALPHVGAMSIGAGMDFLAGTIRRAPKILCNTGLEWSWRLLNEPRRLGPRYWRCVRLLPRLVADARRRDMASGRP
jgi:exopolysaccharide biosynthesis WecB/TagA/CpsF family protein